MEFSPGLGYVTVFTNRQQKKIIYCEAQIKWRERELKILKVDFEGVKLRSERRVG